MKPVARPAAAPGGGREWVTNFERVRRRIFEGGGERRFVRSWKSECSISLLYLGVSS